MIRSLYSLLICFCVQLGGLASAADLDGPPNILIITVDDMNCDSVGVYGCPVPETTPNIDSFARTAMRFTHAHVQVGNCMPSRNVMWSGRYPHNNGVEGVYPNPKPDYPVLCDLAKGAGYFTAIRHKVSHSTPYSPYGWDLDLGEGEPKPHVKDAASYGASTRKGIAAAQLAGKKFCLTINISDPHKPFYSEVKQGEDPHVPSRIYDADEVSVPGFLPDDSVVRQELALYYSSVRRADDAVGEILTALAESDEERSTLVMFLSDHGMPLPFAKTQLYHHSTRTPLMIRYPGTTRPDTVDAEHMVSAVDLLPTLLDVWDGTLPKSLDGRSFLPLLHGQTQQSRDFVVKEYNENSGAKRNPMRAIQTKQFLYIFNPWANGSRKMATATNGTRTYRRMRELAQSDSDVAKRLDLADFRVVEELYDVSRDPDCLENLTDSSRHHSVMSELRNLLLKELVRTGDPVAALLIERDKSAMEAFVVEQQSEADQRRSRRRNQNSAKVQRLRGIIELSVDHIDAADPTAVVVRVPHKLPKRLGKQKLQVTLKDVEGKRIRRQIVEVAGSGEAIVRFALPDNRLAVGSVAAFVGKHYGAHYEHLQVTLK